MDRLSYLLHQAGARGLSDKHRLMRHAAYKLGAVEMTLAAIMRALERGDIDVVKLRLRDITKLLGYEIIVMNHVWTEEYKDNSKQDV